MLDMLFLLGDPKQSYTMIDCKSAERNKFNIGEKIPILDIADKRFRKDNPETRVRIDRTSQLLISMSITIAEFVKEFYNRSDSMDKKLKEQKIRELSGFEEIVRTTVIDKSKLLTKLLNIEIFFFARKLIEDPEDQQYDMDMDNKIQKEQARE